MTARRREADHNAAVELSGVARRPSSMRVLQEASPPIDETWEMKPGVPASREECRGGVRPCPYVRCSMHLWLVDAVDRPGRRNRNGGGPRSVLQPASSESCARDIAERGEKLTCAQVGALLGVSDERVRQIEKRAEAKLRERGYEIGDLLRPQ